MSFRIFSSASAESMSGLLHSTFHKKEQDKWGPQSPIRSHGPHFYRICLETTLTKKRKQKAMFWKFRQINACATLASPVARLAGELIIQLSKWYYLCWILFRPEKCPTFTKLDLWLVSVGLVFVFEFFVFHVRYFCRQLVHSSKKAKIPGAFRSWQ